MAVRRVNADGTLETLKVSRDPSSTPGLGDTPYGGPNLGGGNPGDWIVKGWGAPKQDGSTDITIKNAGTGKERTITLPKGYGPNYQPKCPPLPPGVKECPPRPVAGGVVPVSWVQGNLHAFDQSGSTVSYGLTLPPFPAPGSAPPIPADQAVSQVIPFPPYWWIWDVESKQWTWRYIDPVKPAAPLPSYGVPDPLLGNANPVGASVSSSPDAIRRMTKAGVLATPVTKAIASAPSPTVTRASSYSAELSRISGAPAAMAVLAGQQIANVVSLAKAANAVLMPLGGQSGGNWAPSTLQPLDQKVIRVTKTPYVAQAATPLPAIPAQSMFAPPIVYSAPVLASPEVENTYLGAFAKNVFHTPDVKGEEIQKAINPGRETFVFSEVALHPAGQVTGRAAKYASLLVSGRSA